MCEPYTELRLEHVNPLLKDYEVLIRTLSEQLEFYKEEQNQLKNEVVSLLDENKLLSSKIKEIVDNPDNAINSITHRYSEGDFVQNLKSQINLLVAEKESTVELWKNSLSTIDQLEDELKLYQGRTHGYVSKNEVKKIKSEYEKQLKELEIELIKSKTCLLKTKKSSKNALELKNGELQKTVEVHNNTIKEIQKLENDVCKLKQEQNDIIKMRNQLSKVIEDKNRIIGELRLRDSESKAKVNEAIQIVEVALMEKDSAIIRENQAREELSNISKALTEIVDGTNEKLKSELEGTKKQYHDKILKIRNDMKDLVEQLKTKDVELEKHKSMSKVLEDELDRIKRGTFQGIGAGEMSKLLGLENNLDATFQKLINSEKKCAQLELDNAKMKEELETTRDRFQSAIRSKEEEKEEMRERIAMLQSELQTSNNSLKEVANKVEEVNNKISLIETELRKQLQLKDIQTQELMSTKIREIEEENAKVNNELKGRLASQIGFNQKWKVEVKTITDNLEDHVQELRAEALALKKTNAELGQKLHQAEEQVELYQDYLQRFCLDISNVVASTKQQNVIEMK